MTRSLPRSPPASVVAIVLTLALLEVDIDLACRIGVGADLEGQRLGAVQQRGAVEVGRPGNAVQFLDQAVRFGLDGAARFGVVRVVSSLDTQVTQTLQDGLGLVQAAFSGLNSANAVLGVTSGNREATDLGLQALGQCQAGRVVTGAVDPQAAGKLLQRLGQVGLGVGQAAVSVVRSHVGVDLHSHDVSSMIGTKYEGPSLGLQE